MRPNLQVVPWGHAPLKGGEGPGTSTEFAKNERANMSKTKTKSRKHRSPFLASIHETAKGLHGAGVMDKETMRRFDVMCLTPVRPLTAKQIRALRQRERAIRSDGTVHDVGVVKGNRLLSEAAIEAVQRWRYKPALLSGTPVESDGNAVLNFEYQ